MEVTDIVFGILGNICAEDVACLTEEADVSNHAALVPDGGEFEFSGVRFIRLGEEQGGILCVTKDAIYKDMFNEDWENNDYRSSIIRKKITDEFISRLPSTDLLPYTMDLKSYSNPEEGYGLCADMAGILTEELYRKYRRFIHVDYWEWLCTPYSISPESPWCRCVDASGNVGDGTAGSADRCRPACVFKKII